MPDPRALVGNAADTKQVRYAERKEKRRALHRVELVRQQLATAAGREFVWAELERHGIHDLVSGPADAVYAFLGKRAAGIELLAELMRDHVTAYLLMHEEALKRRAQEAREVEAAHTPPAAQSQGEHDAG